MIFLFELEFRLTSTRALIKSCSAKRILSTPYERTGHVVVHLGLLLKNEMFPGILIENNVLKLSYNESHPFLRMSSEKRDGTTEKENTYLGPKVETVNVGCKEVQPRLLDFRDCLISMLRKWLRITSVNKEQAGKKRERTYGSRR